jgi:hypothetical protein
MSYSFKDGLYQVPLVDFGKQLQSRGWNVAEHSAFGGVSDVHAPNSYHKYDEAIDITWKNNDYGDYDPSGKIRWDDWTDQLGKRLAGSGPEVLHRSTRADHGTHVHLAAKNGLLTLTPEQMKDFGFDVDGNVSSTSSNESSNPDTAASRSDAKAKAQSYQTQSKAQLDAAYDAMRNNPAKAEAEGMKMHNAYFNKPKRVLG